MQLVANVKFLMHIALARRRGKVAADVEKAHALPIGELCGQRIDARDTAGEVFVLPRQDAEQQHLGLRQLITQCLDDGFDTFRDLFITARIEVIVEIVSTDFQHGELRAQPVDFAVPDAPEHLPRAIAADAIVRGTQRLETLVPFCLPTGRIGPALRD